MTYSDLESNNKNNEERIVRFTPRNILDHMYISINKKSNLIFEVSGAKEWNKLPQSLIKLRCKEIFKSRLFN